MSEDVEVRVRAAAPVIQSDPVRTLVLRIGPEVFGDPKPEEQSLRVWLKEAKAAHESDASAIEQALWGTLPGGTYDALLWMMLRRKASLLKIPHASVGVVG